MNKSDLGSENLEALELGMPNLLQHVANIRDVFGLPCVVALTGDIMTMPGLPKVPATEKIDIDENGVISGLF